MNNLIINTERGELKVYFKALEFAAHKHRFQKRKGANGIPYINHPIEVASLLLSVLADPSPEIILAALLHDTLEDTDTKPAEILSEWGQKVCSIVEEVTDNMKLTSEKRKQLQIEHADQLSKEARAIKIADKICNIRDILNTRIRWMKWQKIGYIKWSIEVIQQISSSFPALETEFRKVLQEAEDILKTSFDFSPA